MKDVLYDDVRVRCGQMSYMETGEHSKGIIYVKSGMHKKKGVIFKFCPFCGVDLTTNWP